MSFCFQHVRHSRKVDEDIAVLESLLEVMIKDAANEKKARDDVDLQETVYGLLEKGEAEEEAASIASCK